MVQLLEPAGLGALPQQGIQKIQIRQALRQLEAELGVLQVGLAVLMLRPDC